MKTALRYNLNLVAACLMVLLMGACSSTKHVPQGQYLLDKAKVTVADEKKINTEELYNFLRQQPNHKVLGFAKLQLATYSLSGRDSTKRANRWLRRLGQAPVIYDPELTEASRRQLQLAMVNKGYLDAKVRVDTASTGRKKMSVEYVITAGKPHRVSGLGFNIPDADIRRMVMAGRRNSSLRPGMLLDRNALEAERGRITRQLRDSGYYDITREDINFTADTMAGRKNVNLTFNLHTTKNIRYVFRRVTYVLDAPARGADTVRCGDLDIVYGRDHYLLPKVLDEMCYIVPGRPYSTAAVERTYEALGRLSIVRYINIDLKPFTNGTNNFIDATIYLSRNKKQSASFELEGTNSEGDLGFGVGLTYQHRNLAKGSQLLTAKVRTSYEALSNKLDGLINNRYTEYAGEVGITFPRFECPFLSKSFKQRRLASTEFSFTANYQERPEYTRVIFGTAWKWKWQQQRAGVQRRHTYDLVDINYVRLPRSTINFIDQIAPSNPLLRYSYEDHFIMRMGYTYNRTNRRTATATQNAFAIQPSVSSLRISAETAGNVLYAISSLANQKRNDGVYKVLGIQYAQYVKGEFDYSFTRNFNSRNAMAFHAGFGIAYPYGNSTMVPFEKRFYAGGANGVRGWGVRTLGPGSYQSQNTVTSFINQCGDIRLDFSVEYRAKLFWVLEGAIFIDAGNIWTVKNYENQEGGMFKFNKFYRQLAAAYGVGLRLDFTFFLLRLDMGMKAHNPAEHQEHWPIIHPNWKRDANFHFAVGYPF